MRSQFFPAGTALPILFVVTLVAVRSAPAPSAPRTLLAVPGDTTVALQWDPSPGATGYDVWRASSESSAPILVAGNVSATSFVVSNLNNSLASFFSVSALGPNGGGVPSPRVRAQSSAPVLDLLPAGAKIERLGTGFQFIEGPAWMPEGFLVFSDIPANRLYRWTPGAGTAVFRTNSGQANGNTLDREGRLVTGEHAGRRVSRTEFDGTITALVTNYNGKAFNAPNDVVVKSDGTVWFTDPNYGLGQSQPKRFVFRFHPTNAVDSLIVVASDFDQPNGLCFSPDESLLYIADSGGPHHLRVFDVLSDNTLTNSRVFKVISPGAPDGIRADSAGRLFVTTAEGVHIYSPEGALLGKLRTPETAANVGFGGANGDAVFITAGTTLYGISRLSDLVVTGVRTSSPFVAGGEVLFHVLVKNQGTALVPASAGVRVQVTLDGVVGRFQTIPLAAALPPDASVALACDAGPAPTMWTAAAGNHVLLATVGATSELAESLSTNNTFTNRFSVASPPLDTDGDGVSDVDEGVAGTDPGNALSFLRILSAERSGEFLVLTWASEAGKNYRVTCRSPLNAGDWTDASETLASTGPQSSWTNSLSATVAELFLRIRVVP